VIVVSGGRNDSRWLRVHDDDDDDDDVGKIEWASLYLEHVLIADVSERGFSSAET